MAPPTTALAKSPSRRFARAADRRAAGIAILATLVAGCGSTTPTQSRVTLRPAPGPSAAPSPDSATGEVSLDQRGDRITGTVRVSGLQPDSRHAWSIQGPQGGCAPIDQPANTAVLLRDLVADGQGVVSMRLDVIAHVQVLARGYDIAIYAGASPPIGAGAVNMLLCGDI